MVRFCQLRLFTIRKCFVDEKLLTAEKIDIVVQVNGKLRDKISIDADADEESIKSFCLGSEKVKSFIAGNKIKKVIYVKKTIGEYCFIKNEASSTRARFYLERKSPSVCR